MNCDLTTRALTLVGFRPEHWHYDYPECYAEFNDKLKEVAISQGKPNSILLGGIVGTGKTAMLAILCKSMFDDYRMRISRRNYNDVNNKVIMAEMIKSDTELVPDIFGSWVKYCTHGELSEIWSHEFDDNSDLPDEKMFKEAQVLFLDDLGTAPDTQSGRNMAKLEELIDWRWSNRMKTFIASNISLKDFWKPRNSQWHRIARRLSEPNWMFYQQLTHRFGGKR